MRTLVVDNYDSFTYNLVQYLAELGAEVTVLRNDEATVAAVRAHAPDRLVISPGPKAPEDAGHCLALLREVSPEIPTLGVCLGHQCLGQAYGGRVVRAPVPMHGKVSAITHDGAGVFRGLPSPFPATRYHSLCVEEASLPEALVITARSEDGVIQGLRHRTLPIEGVQFHPESILTESGKRLLANFLGLASGGPS